MRVAAALPILLVLVACGGTTTTAGAPPKAPSSSPSSPSSPPRAPSGPIKVGDRIAPIPGPLAIPAKGAKLTMVNYFATWCGSSQRWMPYVEAMRKKHDGALAVIGVANSDDAPQEELEAFVKASGGSFPVSADKDRRILFTLMPSGWGQAIIVVDAAGVVRLVHRGTQNGVFEEVAAEIDRLLAAP